MDRSAFPGYTPTLIDGYPAWVNDVTGRILPDVRGGDGPTDPPAPGTPPATPPAPAEPATPPPAAVQFTPEQQAYIDSLAGRTREEGRRAGASTREAEIQAYLDAQAAEAERANLEEVERLRLENADLQRQQAEAVATAATEAARARFTTALVLANFNTATINDALTLVGIDPTDDEAAVAAKVQALATRLPALLTPTDVTAPPPPPPSGLKPPAPPAPGATGETAYERGQRLAREQYPHLRTA